MDFAMSQGWDNDSNHRLHRGSRKRGSDSDVNRKGRSAIERPFPKIRLTDRKCGQNGCLCAVPKLRGRNLGKTAYQPKPQDTMEARHKTAIGKKAQLPLAKGKPIKVRKPIK